MCEILKEITTVATYRIVSPASVKSTPTLTCTFLVLISQLNKVAYIDTVLKECAQLFLMEN